MYTNPNPENQAVVSWDDVDSQTSAYSRSQASWGALSQGKTAAQAMQALREAEENLLETYQYDLIPVIRGDPFARLTTVYTGNSDPAPNVWYR
jgi:hypothetical protein